MRNDKLKIKCIFQDDGKIISDILRESFRLYLIRMLGWRNGGVV